MTESSADTGNTGNAGSPTLEEVEGQPWGGPPADASYLVARCYALRRVPLTELGTEDLRLLLGQSIGVPTLVPLALRVLAADPLAEGHFYAGDLLAAVLRLDAEYWTTHPEQRAELVDIVRRVDLDDDELDDTEVPSLVAGFLADGGGGDGSVTAS